MDDNIYFYFFFCGYLSSVLVFDETCQMFVYRFSRRRVGAHLRTARRHQSGRRAMFILYMQDVLINRDLSMF
jgi:hypothetical protein